jgi:hypothetical protein
MQELQDRRPALHDVQCTCSDAVFNPSSEAEAEAKAKAVIQTKAISSSVNSQEIEYSSGTEKRQRARKQ